MRADPWLRLLLRTKSDHLRIKQTIVPVRAATLCGPHTPSSFAFVQGNHSYSTTMPGPQHVHEIARQGFAEGTNELVTPIFP